MMIMRKIAVALAFFVACSVPLQASDSAVTKVMLGNVFECVQHSLKVSPKKTIAALVGGALLVIGVRYLYKCYRIKRLEAQVVSLTTRLKKKEKEQIQKILSTLN